ncbi:hypothetical protein D3C74_128220 [compost metagenome]
MTDGPGPINDEMFWGAIHAHALLVSYMQAGFTRTEALEILKTMMAAAISAGTKQP